MKLKCKIKVGQLCFQDFKYFYWPNNPNGGVFDKDLLFEIKWISDKACRVTAKGFGATSKNGYGNGAIIVYRDKL